MQCARRQRLLRAAAAAAAGRPVAEQLPPPAVRPLLLGELFCSSPPESCKSGAASSDTRTAVNLRVNTSRPDCGKLASLTDRPSLLGDDVVPSMRCSMMQLDALETAQGLPAEGRLENISRDPTS